MVRTDGARARVRGSPFGADAVELQSVTTEERETRKKRTLTRGTELSARRREERLSDGPGCRKGKAPEREGERKGKLPERVSFLFFF